jgi:hypothetical protein
VARRNIEAIMTRDMMILAMASLSGNGGPQAE